MTVQGNGSMLITKAYDLAGDPRYFRGKEASRKAPSRALNTRQYQMFLEIASIGELEEDVMLMSTRRLLR